MGLQSFGRHLWLTIAAVTVMVATITIALAGIVSNITAQNLISHVSENLRVPVYIEAEAAPESVESLKVAIGANPAVSQIEYISSDMALDRLLEIFADDPVIEEATMYLGSRKLPASLSISLNDLDQVEAVQAIALGPKFVGVVDSLGAVDPDKRTAAQTTIERAQAASDFIVNFSLATVIVFGCVACLIIFNTIRIAIFSRRHEIEIMRLVGARSNFIRGSFLLEASLSGLIAGLISVAIVYMGIEAGGEVLARQPEFAPTYSFLTEPWTVVKIFFGSVGAGIFVGMISAYLATERYLRRY